MRKTAIFLQEINLILIRLKSLENEFIESYKDFEGNEFDEQNRCAAEIENLIVMMTHELGSQIAFGIQDLNMLLK